MKPFLSSKRRLIDLGVLIILNIVIVLFWDSWPMACLFSFGFIWNWSASQDLTVLMSNPRYKYSMVKFVGNLQSMIIRPVITLPKIFHFIVKILPAGIFWYMVVLINDSVMPWWMTFAGSAVFELLQVEINLLRKDKAGLS